MKVLSLRLPDDLAERVDVARGDVPWQRWIVRAVEQALASEGRGSEDPGVSLPSLPAPAEPPKRSKPLPQYRESDVLPPARSETYPAPRSHADNVRSSSQSKRDVRPIPKGER